MKKVVLLALLFVLFSSSLFGRFTKPITAKTYYLSVDIGDWAEYTVEKAPHDCRIGDLPLQNASALRLGDRIRFSVFNKIVIPYGTHEQEKALCHVYLNDEKIYEASQERWYITVYVSGFGSVGLNPFNPTGEDYWKEVYSSQTHNFTDSRVISTLKYGNGTLRWATHKKSGIILEYEIYGLHMQVSKTNVPGVIDAPAPFWMQWWFWTIIAVVIVTLAGTVYLKKRKPSISNISPPPTEDYSKHQSTKQLSSFF